MGMRISSGNSSAQGTSQAGAAAWQQRQQSVQDLSKALGANDLDAAKTAYAALTKNAPSGSTSNPNSPLAQLGKALQSGDLAGAQQAFSAMRSHHHHGGQAGSTTPEATPSAPTATLGNNLNVVA